MHTGTLVNSIKYEDANGNLFYCKKKQINYGNLGLQKSSSQYIRVSKESTEYWTFLVIIWRGLRTVTVAVAVVELGFDVF